VSSFKFVYNETIGVVMIQKENFTRQILKNLSSHDFLHLGAQDMAYIRPVQVHNREAYMIYAADGTPLSVMESLDTAIVAVHVNEMEAITLH